MRGAFNHDVIPGQSHHRGHPAIERLALAALIASDLIPIELILGPRRRWPLARQCDRVSLPATYSGCTQTCHSLRTSVRRQLAGCTRKRPGRAVPCSAGGAGCQLSRQRDER